MIVTKSGLKIEFSRLDEWVVSMTVSVPHIKGDKIVAAPRFTVGQLKEELATVEQAPYKAGK